MPQKWRNIRHERFWKFSKKSPKSELANFLRARAQTVSNLESIFSHAYGNFEEQNKALEYSIINRSINYCIIINKII
jgi:hypothetical protein